LPQPPQFAGSLLVSTHVEPHSRLPLGHAQTPATHDNPDGQTWPQLPQFAALVLRSTQDPPQLVVPAAQLVTHCPPEQTRPLHVCPHEPQFVLSLDRSTHAPPHTVRPDMQAQPPDTQLWPVPQAFPQPPQSVSLLDVSTQAPPQTLRPPPQLHAPPTQVWPAPHVVEHPPQFTALDIVSTQIPPHAVWPVWHRHWPPAQAIPAAQAFPHAPQLALSVARSVHALPQVTWPPGHAGPVSGTPPSFPPDSGGIAPTHACRQEICASLSAGISSGIGSPHEGAVEVSFCRRYDRDGSPGVTRTTSPQPLAGTPRSRCSTPAETRSSPSAGAAMP
jgi:hypothetical protein